MRGKKSLVASRERYEKNDIINECGPDGAMHKSSASFLHSTNENHSQSIFLFILTRFLHFVTNELRIRKTYYYLVISDNLDFIICFVKEFL